MDVSLIEDIKTKLSTVISGTSLSYMYFDPNFDFKNNIGCTYEVVNDSNINCFDKKEIIKNFNLRIQLRNSRIEPILSKAELMKTAIYALPAISDIQLVDLINQTVDYDDELKTYEVYLEFDLKT